MALLRGVAKAVLEAAEKDSAVLDREFIEYHTHGFDEYRALVASTPWSDLVHGVAESDTFPAERVGEFYEEATRGRSASHHLQVKAALALVGLQLRILNGVVSLLTTRVENKALAAYVSEQSGASENLQMTTATLEVLACIVFRQPISQAEIDRLFDADKRGLVVKLRDLKLVEEFAGADGRLRFATTEAFYSASASQVCRN